MNEDKPPGVLRFEKEAEPTSGQIVPKSERPHKAFHQGADSSGYAGRTDKRSARRVEKTGAKLENARDKLAKRKPPKRPRPVKTIGHAIRYQAWRFAHGKIHEVEHENAGVEAAHRTELAGERVVRGTSRFIKQRIRTRPARRVRKLEKRDIKAKADLQYRKLTQEHSAINKNVISKLLQKRKLKRRYQKQAREAAKRGAQAAKKTAVTTEKIAEKVVVSVARFASRHPVITLIIVLVIALIIIIQSVMGSVMIAGNSIPGVVAAASYLAPDADIDKAELTYTEWETDLQLQIQKIESARPGYDEYRYDIDDITHNPYELMAFLTAVYN